MEDPVYIAHRLDIWEQAKASREAENQNEHTPITVTLPNGATVEGISYETTPYNIAKGISNSLAKQVVIAEVNGSLWDLHRPLEGDCDISLIKFNDPKGKKVFWHSSAHVLGQALEKIYQGSLCIGPPIESGGFYYDISIPEGTISQEDFSKIESVVKGVVSENQPFERLVLKKEEALEMFKFNQYKVQIINEKVPDGETCTAYRCGPLIDLCRGPHVPNTGVMKGFQITKNSSAYWKGNAENDALQRVYGIAFPSAKELKAWTKLMKEREERDHRNLGKKQELFFFHPLSPGSAFFLPKGMAVYNRLVDYMKYQYNRRGFTEVLTPNIFNQKLWEQSGHWEFYKDDMFCFQCDNTGYALKPMNCPGHCLMFSASAKSYRDLPIRYAEFGVLHRNELSGALSGLTRVRRFQQDDAHIFIRHDQIGEEIGRCLRFMQSVYGIFGFEFTLELSTRPEGKYIGAIETWDNAESLIADALTEFVGADGWKLNPGDGAFYGPKIDIHVRDVMEREHQCATIQLDFNLPERFNLEYQNEEGKMSRPVIIHRAIFGSLERFFAILIEHLNGKWPFWLSPRQVAIVTVMPSVNEYAREVYDLLKNAGYHVDLDDSDRKLPKKIRESQIAQYNYILVIGANEVEKRTVNVRTRENEVKGELSLDEMIAQFDAESKAHL
eukprot:TRINITY_DN325_c0_g1_i1.p1 TRINITY_DN325_c0_g1~~TRINITY_DN325_c0_g1_i1.p1  ORF type:complete len:669 (+),score=172.85 TRINITY_DN325_c0_g1_i1:774-2780(+)